MQHHQTKNCYLTNVLSHYHNGKPLTIPHVKNSVKFLQKVKTFSGGKKSCIFLKKALNISTEKFFHE